MLTKARPSCLGAIPPRMYVLNIHLSAARAETEAHTLLMSNRASFDFDKLALTTSKEKCKEQLPAILATNYKVLCRIYLRNTP
jgi:hypothetical protein